METYKTIDGAINRIVDLIQGDPNPIYEIKIGQWRSKHSEVDLEITERGPMEVHTPIYEGNRYEITIITRAYANDKIRRKYEDYDGCDE